MERVKVHSELHNHNSIGSLLDGMGMPSEIMDRCDELGLNAYAITDHGTEFALYYFAELQEKYKTKILYGIELYEALDHNIQDINNRYFHLLAIAKTQKGIQGLHRLTTLGEFEGKYFKPRVDLTQISEFKDDLIIGSACLAGKINRANDYEKAKTYALEYKEIFGDNFYLELQAHISQDQILANKRLMKLHYETGIPYIITSDSHYVKNEDSFNHSQFINVNRKNADTTITNELYEDCYIHSTDEMYKRLALSGLTEDEITIGLQNTNKIADMCSGKIEFHEPVLPEVKIPVPYKSEDEYFMALIMEGWEERKIEEQAEKDDRYTIEDYRNRVLHEYNVIKQMDYIAYHLIVADFMQFAVREKIPTAPGRGCFTEDALVVTKNKLKKINEVKIGDYVVTDNGQWNQVKKTFKYDIEEPMIEFKYQCQGSSYKKYKNVCTLDHKILVNRNNEVSYIKAENMKVGDLLCQPKIKNNNTENIIIDLQKYNTFGFKYDDNYIYERYQKGKKYKYSPRWLEKQGIINNTFAKKIGKGYRVNKISNKRGINNVNKLLSSTPFKSLDDYQKYINKNGFIEIAIPRYIKIDYLWNTFIGMMYGDGWTQHESSLGLAINSTTKYTYNKYVFCKIADKLGLNILENKSKNKNLIQLYMNSHILNNWFKTDYFESKKGKEKIFNSYLLEQSKPNLKALYNGLKRTDGSLNLENNKFCFDNTSLSLINAFKILNNKLNYEPMSLDVRLSHIDSRGYNCQESYKIRRPIERRVDKLQSDNNYWYLPVVEINKLNKQKISVYDMEIENNHSYMINNIIVHNSGAGSMINYLLKITNINPMKYDLLFERYLNIERVSLPDIDSDFSSGRRDEVFKYLQNKYGEEYVAQIINFSKYTPKVAMADAGKMLNVPLKDVNTIKEFMQDDTIDKSIENAKGNIKLKNLMSEYPNLLDLARSFEGRIKTTSTNACGSVISSTPINQYCGMKKGENNEQLLQVDKVITEKLGMVKCDILGTTVLQILDDVMISNGTSFYDIYDKIPLDDEATYKFLEKGLYYGVFQLGSYNMTKFFMKLKPKTIEDICLGISAYRPGSMKYIDTMIRRKNGEEKLIYDHPLLEPILKNTYGVAVYQENVMQILQSLGGFSFSQADLVRRGMSKKIQKYVLERRNAFVYGEVKLKNEFDEEGKNVLISYEKAKKKYKEDEYEILIEGCIHREIDEKVAKKIYTDLEDFALYGFNKSHGLAYALLSYYTAYLKCHYPIIFMKTILSYTNDNMEISKYLTQCKDLNINVMNPDINHSEIGFSIYNDSILYGIGSLFNVGEPTVEQIIKKRPYSSFEDFLNKNVYNIEKGEIKINKSALISLVNSGCFDKLPIENESNSLSNRETLLCKIFYNNTDLITKVSATNIIELFDNDMVDKNKFIKEKVIYDLHKVLLSKKNKLDIYKDDSIIIKLKNNYTQDCYEIDENSIKIIKNKYTKEYDKHLKPLKEDLKSNSEEYSKEINKRRVLNSYLNYKKDRDNADLEFESTSFYFSESWLQKSKDEYDVDEFNEIPNLIMEEVGYYKKKELYIIVGVLTGKIKKHKEIVILTNSGIVICKLGDLLYNSVASDLDRGNKIALSGYVGDGFFRAEYYENGKSNKLKALKVID